MENIIANFSRVKRHSHYVTNPIYEQCSYVFDLPVNQRCNFVSNTESCQELEYKFDCAKFMFCLFGDGFDYIYWLPTVILILFGIFLIYIINMFITKFFVDTTLSIGRLLDFNEYLTGVVVITIANSMYNFYFVFYNTTQNPGLIYNSLVGTALIDFGILVPVVILMVPHSIIKSYTLIDAAFIILNFIWLDIFYQGRGIGYLKSIFLAAGYIVYAIFLWIDQRFLRWRFTYDTVEPDELAELMYAKKPFKIFANFHNKKMYTDEEDKFMIKARRYAEWFNPLNQGPMNENLFKQFKDDLLEFSYSDVSTFIKAKRIFDTPFVVLFRFIMPIVDFRKPCHKWSKLLRIINVILFPLACWFALDLSMEYYQYIFYATLILAIIIFFTSRTDRAPEYYPIYGLCAFFGYTFITFGIMSIVENIISSVFMMLKFNIEATGHLAISFFDIIPDISLAVNMVQRGYPKIAWSGCFATVIFRGYFEMGIRFIIRAFNGDKTELMSGTMGPTGSIFGILQIVFLCFGLKTTKFFARRAIAIFLILTYVIFIIFSLLEDNEQLHGYATEHLNEHSLQEDWLSLKAIPFIRWFYVK